MRRCKDALAENGIVINEFKSVGAATKSSLYMQIRADVFGVPVKTMECEQGSALGAAVCAAVATGAYPDIPAAVDGMVRVRQAFTPNADNHAFYTKQYEKYKALYSILKPVR